MKHLLYRFIERNDNPDKDIDDGISGLEDVNENSKISEILHSVFNFEAGDSYAWPCDNIEKDEVDRLWDLGQRAFYFDMGSEKRIMYDIKLMTPEEYYAFWKSKTDKRNELIEELTELFDNNEDESYRNFIKKEVDEILRKHKI